MKKVFKYYGFYKPNIKWHKLLLTMRITLFLFFAGMISVIASPGYSQNTKISISMQDATIESVLNKIEDQSEYFFLFNQKMIDVERKVSINAKDEPIKNILSELFPKDVKFIVSDRQIILTPAVGSSKLEKLLQQQQITVSGKVTDSQTGEPIAGVNVVVKGTTTGTMTDAAGNYSLNVPDKNATLVFSFVGYTTQEIPLAGRSSLNVSLVSEAVGLEEVVVIGYGTAKKSDLTGSLSQVKSKEINAFPSTNVLQALTGRSSGVQVMQSTGAPGASVSIRIRGINSIQGSNEPLFVVDGFPVNNSTAINNSEIESIEILKDASSTAIFGSRGANGVVLITTKKGKAGSNVIDFESSYSSQSLIRKLDLMNAKEYATLYNKKAINDGVTPYFTENEINNFGTGFDWQDFIYRTAPIFTTSLNVNGGNDKTKFSISGSVFKQDGIIEGSTYDRYSVRSNLDHQFSKKFSASLSSNFSRIKTDRKDSGGGSRGNTLISAQFAPPTLTPYNEDGSYRILSVVYPFVAPDLINPLNFIKEQSDVIKANIYLINAALVFNPIEELNIKISGGMENRDDRSDSYTTRKFFNSNGSASVSTGQFISLLNENVISYNKSFNNIHNISAVVGFTYQDFINTSLRGSGTGFLSDVFETYNLSASITPGIPGSNYYKSVLLSYLGRINYNFKNKYFVTASYRADGASKFSEGKKWGLFPSIALAWKISEERFLKDKNVISNLKLRGSWGATGSQAIDPYVTLNQLFSGKTVFNDGLYNTFSPGTTLPGELKWETTEQMNIGLDLGIKNNLFNFTIDYYTKNTKDLLNTVLLPSSIGFKQTVQNIGKVQNKGLEFGLDAKIFTGAFQWDINSNISFNKNRVVKLSNGEDILGGYVSVVALQDNTNILREGRPIGQFWGYMKMDIPSNGQIKYKDLEPDGKLTIEDKTYIGDPNPDFIFGLNSNISYKNFDLNIFLQGTYGNDLFNLSAVSYSLDYVSGMNMIRDVLKNSWTINNTNAKYPIISRNTSVNVSDRFVEDGSYLRLKNIQLAYNLPLTKTVVRNNLQSLQIYLSGQNILTLTRYSGWDPEVNSESFGIDNKTYPNSKSFTIGVRVRF